jgi:hypothetical protein
MKSHEFSSPRSVTHIIQYCNQWPVPEVSSKFSPAALVE